MPPSCCSGVENGKSREVVSNFAEFRKCFSGGYPFIRKSITYYQLFIFFETDCLLDVGLIIFLDYCKAWNCFLETQRK